MDLRLGFIYSVELLLVLTDRVLRQKKRFVPHRFAFEETVQAPAVPLHHRPLQEDLRTQPGGHREGPDCRPGANRYASPASLAQCLALVSFTPLNEVKRAFFVSEQIMFGEGKKNPKKQLKRNTCRRSESRLFWSKVLL